MALINESHMFDCRFLLNTGFAGLVRPFGWHKLLDEGIKGSYQLIHNAAFQQLV